MSEPTEEEIKRRAYQLWEQQVAPRTGTAISIVWLSRSCATRISPIRLGRRQSISRFPS